MKYIIIGLLLTLPVHAVMAQQFKWVKMIGSLGGGVANPGGGTSTLHYPGENCNYLCTDNNKNLYGTSIVTDSSLRADTFYQSQGTNKFAIHSLLTSYRCDGTMRWARLLEGKGDVICYGLQYSAGCIYMAGRFGDTGANCNRYIAGVPITGHDFQHYFLARFDTLGSLRWLRFVGANDQSSAIVLSYLVYGTDDHSLAIDGRGNIHHFAYLNNGVKITPSITAQTGTYDLKYDTAGTLLTAVRLGVDSNYFLYDHQGRSLVYKNTVSISKKSGKIFTVMSKVAFSTQHIVVYTQYRLCAFAPGGALIWEDSLAGNTSTYPEARIRDACYDGANAIYLSGEGRFGQFQFSGALPNYTPTLAQAGLTAIIKVDTNGLPVWIYANEHHGNFGLLGNTTMLPNGNILAACNASGIVIHDKDSIIYPRNNQAFPFYTIVTPMGNLVKIEAVFSNRRSNACSFTSATVDHIGNIYLGGYQGDDTLQFPGGLYSTKFPYLYNSSDAFIAKLGLDCRCTAPAKAAYTTSIANERTATFTYTGTTEVVDSIVWTYGHGLRKKVTTGLTTPFTYTYASFNAYANDTICVTVYSACGIDKSCQYPAPLSVAAVKGMESVQVYPNPAQTGHFAVSLEAGYDVREVSIIVSNITGQHVYRQSFHPAGNRFSEEIDLHDAAKGVYFVEVMADGEQAVRRVIIQ